MREKKKYIFSGVCIFTFSYRFNLLLHFIIQRKVMKWKAIDALVELPKEFLLTIETPQRSMKIK